MGEIIRLFSRLAVRRKVAVGPVWSVSVGTKVGMLLLATMLPSCVTTRPLPAGKTAAITCQLGAPRVTMAGSTLLVSCPRVEVSGEGL